VISIETGQTHFTRVVCRFTVREKSECNVFKMQRKLFIKREATIDEQNLKNLNEIIAP